MEDIKVLIKKAKKEEKKNPEFLYKLGLRFKDGVGTDQNDSKAAKYFEKAADLGHAEAQIETAMRWWKYWNSYYYAKLYLNKAIEQGNERAKEILFTLEQEEQAKKAGKNSNVVHCSNVGKLDLYKTPDIKDDDYTKFMKKHTLVCCPACRSKINLIKQNSVGELTKEYITIYDEGTPWEKRSDPYMRPTYDGQTLTQTYECENCKLTFDKIINTKYDEREAEPTWKEIFTENNRTEWVRVVKISYLADKTKAGKDVLKILKKSEGKYEEK